MAILYVWSGAAGSGSGADWTNAKTNLTAAFVTEVAGDTLYVAHDHAESTAGALTLTSSGTLTTPTKVICVNRAGSVPPVSADRLTTAVVATSANNNINLAGCTHYDGIIFSAGTGASSSALIVAGTTSLWLRFDNCQFRFPITNAASGALFIGGASGNVGGTYFEMNNTTFSNAAGPSNLITFAGALRWRNTPTAMVGAGMPVNVFLPTATRGGLIDCVGVDFSALGSGKSIVSPGLATQGAVYKFVDCKLDAAVTKVSVTPVAPGAAQIDFVRSGATGNYAVYSQNAIGTLIEETTIVRTDGASDGVTPISWKVVTTTNASYSMPFETPPIAIWCDTTGSAKTATVEGIWGGGAVPTDEDIWLEVEYLGNASAPQGSFVNDGKADLIIAAANQTSSSETWGGSTTAFKMAVTFTPQQKGWIFARVKVGKVSTTVYIDPLVTLS